MTVKCRRPPRPGHGRDLPLVRLCIAAMVPRWLLFMLLVGSNITVGWQHGQRSSVPFPAATTRSGGAHHGSFQLLEREQQHDWMRYGYDWMRYGYGPPKEERTKFLRLLMTSNDENHVECHDYHVVVVGKIIVDEYGKPQQDDDQENKAKTETSITSTFSCNSPKRTEVTIGGGGPQAALGAALALAARSLRHRQRQQQEEATMTTTTPFSSPLPPRQPVTLLAAVGDLDFGSIEQASLQALVAEALCEPPRLIRGKNCVTPKIRLWHDDDQVIQWFPVLDSFGPQGAQGLWGSVPTVQDYRDAITTIKSGHDNNNTRNDNKRPVVLHVIVEGGAQAPGGNGDSQPLLDPTIRAGISFLGVEPITFPADDDEDDEEEEEEQRKDNKKGVVERDAQHCGSLLQLILMGRNNIQIKSEDHGSNVNNDFSSSPPPLPVVISPDMALYESLVQGGYLPVDYHQSKNDVGTPATAAIGKLDSWSIRNGPQGSVILAANSTPLTVPAAELIDGKLVNPTGAGNAYAAAYTALRGTGSDVVTSACIATGVGAAFCECDHCPTWTWDTVQRIVRGSYEVEHKLLLVHSKSR